METKWLDLGSAQGHFSGYAAVFGEVDRHGDRIEPGAFTTSLRVAETKRAGSLGTLYPLLWMHDLKEPLGAITTAREDSHGLYIEGQLDLDTKAGRQAFSALQSGYATQFSIGYRTVQASRDRDGVRHLKAVELSEVSLVTNNFAAQPDATVTAGSVKRVPLATDHTDQAPESDVAKLVDELRAYCRRVKP